MPNESQVPYEPPKAPLVANATTANAVREVDYFLAWFLTTIVAGVAGYVVAWGVGWIIGFVGTKAGASARTLEITMLVVAGIVGMVISYMAFRFFVGRILVGEGAEKEAGGAI